MKRESLIVNTESYCINRTSYFKHGASYVLLAPSYFASQKAPFLKPVTEQDQTNTRTKPKINANWCAMVCNCVHFWAGVCSGGQLRYMKCSGVQWCAKAC